MSRHLSVSAVKHLQRCGAVAPSSLCHSCPHAQSAGYPVLCTVCADLYVEYHATHRQEISKNCDASRSPAQRKTLATGLSRIPRTRESLCMRTNQLSCGCLSFQVLHTCAHILIEKRELCRGHHLDQIVLCGWLPVLCRALFLYVCVCFHIPVVAHSFPSLLKLLVDSIFSLLPTVIFAFFGRVFASQYREPTFKSVCNAYLRCHFENVTYEVGPVTGCGIYWSCVLEMFEIEECLCCSPPLFAALILKGLWFFLGEQSLVVFMPLSDASRGAVLLVGLREFWVCNALANALVIVRFFSRLCVSMVFLVEECPEGSLWMMGSSTRCSCPLCLRCCTAAWQMITKVPLRGGEFGNIIQFYNSDFVDSARDIIERVAAKAFQVFVLVTSNPSSLCAFHSLPHLFSLPPSCVGDVGDQESDFVTFSLVLTLSQPNSAHVSSTRGVSHTKNPTFTNHS